MFLWCICPAMTSVWLALIVVIATNLLLESSKRVQLNVTTLQIGILMTLMTP